MKPRLLDAFCGAGGCSRGYQEAGFEVVGIDNRPQLNYCGDDFILGDALDVLTRLAAGEGVEAQSGRVYFLEDFVAVHASPPCQAYSDTQQLQSNEHPALIAPTRELLEKTGLPYVIKNVPGARAELRDPIELCGTMFELPLYRHRLFECSFPVTAPLHGQHWLRQVKMGRPPGPDEIQQPVGNFSGAERGREAMGIDWMTKAELAQAIPPAYTTFIGEFLMAEINARKVAA